MTQLLERSRIPKSKEVKKLISRFPAAMRTKSWPEMVRLADAGRYDDAFAMGVKMETRPHILQQNVVARRFRVERVALIGRLAQADKDLKQIMKSTAEMIIPAVLSRATSPAGLPYLKKKIAEMDNTFRRELKKWMNALLRDSAWLGLRHAQDALHPIFRANREGAIQEARTAVAISTKFANMNDPEIDEGSAKWIKVVQDVLDDNAAEVVGGMNLAQRIYDMTKAGRREVERLVADGIATGRSTERIASDISQYMSPSTWTDELGATRIPRGAYYSPYKNAYRLARTETASVYTQTTMAFAKDKWWITGVMFTLAPAHDVDDECDDYAGQTMSPEEFENLVPVHPHCMCFPTYVFDPEVLGDDSEEDTTDEEQ